MDRSTITDHHSVTVPLFSRRATATFALSLEDPGSLCQRSGRLEVIWKSAVKQDDLRRLFAFFSLYGSVCCKHICVTIHSKASPIFAHDTCCRGSVLLWRHCKFATCYVLQVLWMTLYFLITVFMAQATQVQSKLEVTYRTAAQDRGAECSV